MYGRLIHQITLSSMGILTAKMLVNVSLMQMAQVAQLKQCLPYYQIGLVDSNAPIFQLVARTPGLYPPAHVFLRLA